jgi:lysophospholipase L1-like esterase
MEMHPMQMTMASWLIKLLMLTFLAIASPDPDSRQPLHRRGKMLYEALGDSYAAGTGAGKIINKDSHCQQFTDSYPMLLNTLLDDGETMPAETHHACPGATVEDIIKYQRTNLSANLVRTPMPRKSVPPTD